MGTTSTHLLHGRYLELVLEQVFLGGKLAVQAEKLLFLLTE